jgi:hypothetical protein
MKAQDYFEKYKESVYNEALEGKADAAKEMYFAFIREVNDLIKIRHVKTDKAAISIIKELNQKWNKLANLFEAEYGQCVLKRNAIWNYFADKIPEINKWR